MAVVVMQPMERWAIVELMGHRKVAGRVEEVERYGTKMIRIDIPMPSGDFATQFYGGNAVYCESPVTEDIARAFASNAVSPPVSEWELRKALPPVGDDDDGDEDGGRPW